MTKELPASLSGTLFSSDQRQALDAIGAALKQHAIDFMMASELSDLIKQGRTRRALRELARVRP